MNVGSLISLVLIVVFGDLAGLALATICGLGLVHYSRWPAVKASITRSRIGNVKRGANDNYSFVQYSILAAYEYVVNGVTYFSRGDEQMDSGFGDEKFEIEVMNTARSILARYPVGGQITISYNSKKPQEHQLKLNRSGYLVGCVFSLIWTSVSIWLTVWWVTLHLI